MAEGVTEYRSRIHQTTASNPPIIRTSTLPMALSIKVPQPSPLTKVLEALQSNGIVKVFRKKSKTQPRARMIPS